MKLAKNFYVYSIETNRSSNVPLVYTLESEGLSIDPKQQSTFMLNHEDKEELGLPESLTQIGYLKISLTSVKIPYKKAKKGDKGELDFGKLRKFDLPFWTVKRTERRYPYHFMYPPKFFEETQTTLTVSASGGGDGIHPHVITSPDIKIIVLLSDKEYEEVRQLPVNTAFRLSLTVIPE